MAILLLLSVFVIATCGLVYELITGTLASYLLGDSVTQFSTVIGTYLFAMGIGSYLSRHVRKDLLSVFVRVELMIGLVGGSSAAALFLLFEHVSSFRVVLYGTVVLTGMLVGLEIPLLMRILSEDAGPDGKAPPELKELVSQVFTFDYVGALIASLLFPLFLVPHLGLMRSSFLFGMMNVGVALATLHVLKPERFGARSQPRALAASGVACLIFLALGFAYSDQLMAMSEESLYPGHVLYSRSTPYQRIVLTRNADDFRLYLNAHLQFSSRDEYRYHEALVHVGLDGLENPRHVLILGGGDGMALREVLKHPGVEKVTMVDLDTGVTDLFQKHEALSELNGGALRSPKLELVHADAFVWIKEQERQPNPPRFDFIIVDFPDPANFSIGKLYSTSFFELLGISLAPQGKLVVQSTSPLSARKSYWCVEKTLRAAGLHTLPYHAYVPSFGEWGFVLAGHEPPRPPEKYVAGLKFVNPETVTTMLQFPADMAPVETEVNRLNNQALVNYYEHEWTEYAQ